MLSDEQIVEHFATSVSLEQREQQAHRQRQRQLVKQLQQHYSTTIGVLLGCSIFAVLTAMIALSVWPVFGVGALVVSMMLMLTSVRMIRESDGDWKPRLIRRTYRRFDAALASPQLDAHVNTSLVDDKMLVTSVVYNGRAQEVERAVIEPNTEEAVALASRMVVRNRRVDQQLLDPQSLPQQKVTHDNTDYRQLLTAVLKTPATDEPRALTP